MWIGVVTLFPEMFALDALHGVFARAVNNATLTLRCANPRAFTSDKHRTVDDKPYGGGAGMVMMAEPLVAAVTALQQQAAEEVSAISTGQQSRLPVIMLTPAGRPFDQVTAVSSSTLPGLILVCGRYEGVDQRFIDAAVDEQWSLGDFVLSGGELPALAVMDAVARHIPGVLGNFQSNLDESHLDGTLEYPQYTRPEMTLGQTVPDELLSGHHARVNLHRRGQALAATYRQRPDLLTGRVFSETDRALLAEFLATEK